jgi:CRP-like cAMP-binding protein
MSYPLSNVLIDALPDASRRKLMGHLKPVPIPIRTSLYEPDDTPKYVHFLTSGIASIVTTMSDGDTTEVGTTGREGLPQGVHLLGSAPVSTRCFMQIAGTGLRMEFQAFAKLIQTDADLLGAVLAYSQYNSIMLGQLAGCNRVHGVEARLARWLLMIQDRTSDSVMKLTQEFLAQMIGSQRTTVSSVVGALEERGLIQHSRGTIRLLNRTGLENAACECYPVTQKLLASLYLRGAQKIFDEDE